MTASRVSRSHHTNWKNVIPGERRAAKQATRRGRAGSSHRAAVPLLRARQREEALAFLGCEASGGGLVGLGEADLQCVAVQLGDALERLVLVLALGAFHRD